MADTSDREKEQPDDERARGVKEDVGLVGPRKERLHGSGDATRETVVRPKRDEDGVRPNEFRHT